jgi:hypothetical protein
MPLVGFEPTVSAGERPKTHALDRAATGTGYQKAITVRKHEFVFLSINFRSFKWSYNLEIEPVISRGEFVTLIQEVPHSKFECHTDSSEDCRDPPLFRQKLQKYLLK